MSILQQIETAINKLPYNFVDDKEAIIYLTKEDNEAFCQEYKDDILRYHPTSLTRVQVTNYRGVDIAIKPYLSSFIVYKKQLRVFLLSTMEEVKDSGLINYIMIQNLDDFDLGPITKDKIEKSTIGIYQNVSLNKISDLRGKMTKQGREEIDSQISKLRDEWDRGI